MANIRINRQKIYLRYKPFPVSATGSVLVGSLFHWTPVERPDVGDQQTTLTSFESAGSSIASSLVRLQNAASNYLESQLGARGRDLVDSPVSSLEITFTFNNPFNEVSSQQINWKASWSPVSYPFINAKETGTATINSGSQLFTDLTSVVNFSKTLAEDRYPDHTIVLPSGSVE